MTELAREYGDGLYALTEEENISREVLEQILCKNFLRRVGQTPRPVCREALRDYWRRYRRYALVERIAKKLDEALEI